MLSGDESVHRVQCGAAQCNAERFATLYQRTQSCHASTNSLFDLTLGHETTDQRFRWVRPTFKEIARLFINDFIWFLFELGSRTYEFWSCCDDFNPTNVWPMSCLWIYYNFCNTGDFFYEAAMPGKAYFHILLFIYSSESWCHYCWPMRVSILKPRLNS